MTPDSCNGDKIVYVTLIYHGNMCWDRYTKDQIRRDFTKAYRLIVDVWKKHPELRSNVELSGVTVKTLQQTAPDLLEDMKRLEKTGRLVFVGTHYAAQVNLCTDEETELRSIRLGTEINRRELGVKVHGFWPQEISYYPQLPRVLREAGLEWTVIRPIKFRKRPIRLRGLDGSEIIGIPLCNMQLIEDFEQLYDQCSDGDLIAFGGDFEANWPDILSRLLKAVNNLRKKGKRIEFATVPEYLMKHPIVEVEEMPVFRASNPEESDKSPSLSRWVSDPLDIIVHEQTKRAMYAVRHAETLATLVKEAYGVDVNLPIEKSKMTLIDDPAGWSIEDVKDFPQVETDYLSLEGKPTMLSRMWHYLLLGVNSDSRGWYPIIERRRHRICSLKNAELLALEVISNALRVIGGRISLIGMKGDHLFVVYNPLRNRKAHITLRLDSPYKFFDVNDEEIPSFSRLTSEGIITEAIVDVPDYGYTIIKAFKKGKLEKSEWRPGKSIQKGSLRLEYENGSLKLRRGDEEIELFLEPFKLRLLGKDEKPRIVFFKADNATVKIRKRLNPEMIVYSRLDWGVGFKANFTLEEDVLRCEVEFDFRSPSYVGEGRWMPNGLTFSVKSKPGNVYYDIPYGVVKHHYDEECHIAASRFAALQSDESGVAMISTSGAQSFKCNAKEGLLGIVLGASTIGTPIEPPKIVFMENGQFHHQLKTDGEIFAGKYRHTFVIYPYKGDWRDADVPHKARQENESVYVVEVPKEGEVTRGDEPPAKSFISLHPRNVEITAIRPLKEGFEIALMETHNRDADVELRVLDKTLKTRISANGFVTLKI